MKEDIERGRQKDTYTDLHELIIYMALRNLGLFQKAT